MLLPGAVQRSQRLITSLVGDRILKPVDRTKALTTEPAVVLCCCDYTQLERLEHCRRHIVVNPQEIKLHGGGLLLDPNSPANAKHNNLATIKHQVGLAIEAKGKISQFMSFVDWRCGISSKHDMDAETIFRSAITGKMIAKEPGEFLEGWQVRLFFYLHDYSFLDSQLAFIREHPGANGFTFYFGAKETLDYLRTWEDPIGERELVS